MRGALGFRKPPMNSSGQGTVRTIATGSIKLKWLATTTNGPLLGKFSCPTMCRSESTKNAARASTRSRPRSNRRRGYRIWSPVFNPLPSKKRPLQASTWNPAGRRDGKPHPIKHPVRGRVTPQHNPPPAKRAGGGVCTILEDQGASRPGLIAKNRY